MDCWCKWLRFIVHISNKTDCNLNACCYWKPCTQFDAFFIYYYFAALFPVDMFLCAGQRSDGLDFLHHTFSMQTQQCVTFPCLWDCLLFIHFTFCGTVRQTKIYRVIEKLRLLVWVSWSKSISFCDLINRNLHCNCAAEAGGSSLKVNKYIFFVID